jgi:urease accessory protein
MDEITAANWIKDILIYGLAYGDLALLSHFYQAWSEDDQVKEVQLINVSLALRETAELKQEDQHIAKALLRLVIPLGIDFPRGQENGITYPWVFARFAQHWKIPLAETLQAFAWSWLENQVAAMVKLVPLGQTQGQILMLQMDEAIQQSIAIACSVEQDDIGSSLPNLAILSSRHEIQYSRLFRS